MSDKCPLSVGYTIDTPWFPGAHNPPSLPRIPAARSWLVDMAVRISRDLACSEQPAAAHKTLLAVKERYEELCRRRRLVLEDRKILAIHARTEPYRDIWNRFSAVIDDYDDCEVILDAHDVAATIDGMVLYTGDYRHIIANRDLILSETSLYDVRGLGGRTPEGGTCE